MKGKRRDIIILVLICFFLIEKIQCLSPCCSTPIKPRPCETTRPPSCPESTTSSSTYTTTSSRTSYTSLIVIIVVTPILSIVLLLCIIVCFRKCFRRNQTAVIAAETLSNQNQINEANLNNLQVVIGGQNNGYAQNGVLL